MSSIDIHDLDDDNEYFVGTCSHVNESLEIDKSSKMRVFWLKKRRKDGVKVLVAHVEGVPKGFIHLMPIEISPWGPIGIDSYVIPCIYIVEDSHNLGIGSKLLESAEMYASEKGASGIVSTTYFHNYWYMPAQYFIKKGYQPLVKRSTEVIVGKIFDESFSIPKILNPTYKYNKIDDKIVVDLFWNTFCETSIIEANRVKKACKEFGKDVILNEHLSDIKYVLTKYQIPRGTFINGIEHNWGYEAPLDELKKIITLELGNLK